MTELPQAFLERMRGELRDEFPAFAASYHEPRTFGLRLNPLKTGEGDARDIVERFGCRPVPWCPTGYYYEESARPGKHPYHEAGLYYIQEPSAMIAAELLRPEPGDIVLDLAAAPGGKATQIAGMLAGRGLLVANDIHPARAKALAENLERWGAANCIVTSGPPAALAARFPECFDKIMLDAPCSGEGMFRKDPDTIAEWSPEQVSACAARQLDILEQAVPMLKPGGVLVYSTCTFSREENEQVIERLTERRPEMTCVKMERIWPHLHDGEGHFAAVLVKADRDAGKQPFGRPRRPRESRTASAGGGLREAYRLFRSFAQETLPELALPEGEPLLFGDWLYWWPKPRTGDEREAAFHPAALDGLKVLRPGLQLAQCKKGRVEPAHALALYAETGKRHPIVRLAAEEPALQAFLRGEAIPAPASASGWVLVGVDDHPVGWGKAGGGWIKNHIPKGLRRPG